MTYNRDSNVELMRLICMIMILIHHLIIRLFFNTDIILMHQGGVNPTEVFFIVLNSFCYIGVNCFLLISGYYGIRFKLCGLLNLYLICVFYSLITHCEDVCILKTESFTIWTIKDIILVFSQQHYWWYIKCYVILYLFSPLLNKALNHFTKHEYRFTLVLMAIANLYFGYWWGKYNPDGYNVGHFVFVYIIGRYIGRFVSPNFIDNKRYFSISCYVIVILIFSTLSVAAHYLPIPHWQTYPYNNPLLLVGSLCFFLFMLSFHFHNLSINKLATSALSIYLLQNLALFTYLSKHIDNLGVNIDSDNYIATISSILIYLLLFSFAFATISIYIDKLRILITRPIIRAFNNHFATISGNLIN